MTEWMYSEILTHYRDLLMSSKKYEKRGHKWFAKRVKKLGQWRDVMHNKSG